MRRPAEHSASERSAPVKMVARRDWETGRLDFVWELVAPDALSGVARRGPGASLLKEHCPSGGIQH